MARIDAEVMAAATAPPLSATAACTKAAVASTPEENTLAGIAIVEDTVCRITPATERRTLASLESEGETDSEMSAPSAV